MEGTLWRWNCRGQVAFISAQKSSNNHIICLGGLTDGLYPCPWVEQLNQKCLEIGWALVQPTLSGSYTGYGTGTLDRDVEELSEFILHLHERWNCQRLVIVGHSTGCQIAIHLTNFGSEQVLSLLYGIVLQAPVSDQEAGSLTPETEQYLQWARQQPPQLLHTLMPIDSHYSPITIQRYLSLFDRYGQDDYFSSYLTDQELQKNFSGILSRSSPLVKILIAYSMSDEYVPSTVDKELLVDRLVAVLGPRAEALKLPQANHNLSAPSDGSSVQLFISAIEAIFREILSEAIDRLSPRVR
jgi:pimeloyl-ACP methyl ester carboxylesterase